jgi:hypothetical protein
MELVTTHRETKSTLGNEAATLYRMTVFEVERGHPLAVVLFFRT